jgi:SPP1 family phage portal protein
MADNIKNIVREVKYPKLRDLGEKTLSDDEIIQLIDNNQKNVNKYEQNKAYYLGNNTRIIKQEELDINAPDNRISAPYSRTMVNIIKGYMGKPGSITYSNQEKIYEETMSFIFDENDEEIKTAEAIENQSKYGVNFEIVWIDQDIIESIDSEDEIEINTQSLQAIRFTKVLPQTIIPILTEKVEPSLQAFIRYFLVLETEQFREWEVEVYYRDEIITYRLRRENNSDKVELVRSGSVVNVFGEPPLIWYPNNDELIADYEPVKTFIDSYDKMNSDALNELDRFAAAYMILKNYILSTTDDPIEKQRVLQQLKKYRVFEVQDDGDIRFLTKDIPDDFFNSLKATLREDIEYHSHIPDFRSQAFQVKSGEAFKWALLNFENLASEKESNITKGLIKRIEIINRYMSNIGIEIGQNKKWNIEFKRNIPSNKTEIIDQFIKLVSVGKLSDETLLRFISQVIDIDIVQELKAIEERKLESQEMFESDDDEEENEEE